MQQIRHPLVVDAETKLCRPITDADVRIMEAKCHAYDALILSLRESIRMADYHADALRRVYGPPGCKGHGGCEGTPAGYGCTCIG